METRKIDITDIPFEDGSFDFAIANHMLYHVPDLDKAIGEVHRVLKPDGVFYATTTGGRGLSDYLNTTASEILGNPVEPSHMSFSFRSKWFDYYTAKRDSDGLLHVPKESGMFISRK